MHCPGSNVHFYLNRAVGGGAILMREPGSLIALVNATMESNEAEFGRYLSMLRKKISLVGVPSECKSEKAS